MLDQRQRRWSDVVQMLHKCLLRYIRFSEKSHIFMYNHVPNISVDISIYTKATFTHMACLIDCEIDSDVKLRPLPEYMYLFWDRR